MPVNVAGPAQVKGAGIEATVDAAPGGFKIAPAAALKGTEVEVVHGEEAASLKIAPPASVKGQEIEHPAPTAEMPAPSPRGLPQEDPTPSDQDATPAVVDDPAELARLTANELIMRASEATTAEQLAAIEQAAQGRVTVVNAVNVRRQALGIT